MILAITCVVLHCIPTVFVVSLVMSTNRREFLALEEILCLSLMLHFSIYIVTYCIEMTLFEKIRSTFVDYQDLIVFSV